jgi:hypothetical protein
MRRPSISLFQLSTKPLSYLSASDTYTAHSLAAAASSSGLIAREIKIERLLSRIQELYLLSG